MLPATTQLEHTDLHRALGNYYVQLNRPAIAPRGESKPNTEVFRLLAAQMGFTEPCFRDSDDDLIDQALASEHPHMHGITRALLERDGWAKLRLPEHSRPSRRVASRRHRAKSSSPRHGWRRMATTRCRLTRRWWKARRRRRNCTPAIR